MVFKFVLDLSRKWLSCLLAPLLQVQFLCHALVSVLQEHFGHDSKSRLGDGNCLQSRAQFPVPVMNPP